MLGTLYLVWYGRQGFNNQWWADGGHYWGEMAYGALASYPTLGLYDSRDRSIIRQHIVWMKQAGFDFVVIDFLGKWADSKDHTGLGGFSLGYPYRSYNSYLNNGEYDQVNNSPYSFTYESGLIVADECRRANFPFRLMLDQVGKENGGGFGFQTSDIMEFANNPLYLTEPDGRKVIYYYGVDTSWQFGPGWITRHFNGWLNQYNAPGFDNTNICTAIKWRGTNDICNIQVIDRLGGSTYLKNLSEPYAEGGDTVVFTWNDHLEGDAIEPTQPWPVKPYPGIDKTIPAWGMEYINLTRQYVNSVGASRPNPLYISRYTSGKTNIVEAAIIGLTAYVVLDSILS